MKIKLHQLLTILPCCLLASCSHEPVKTGDNGPAPAGSLEQAQPGKTLNADAITAQETPAATNTPAKTATNNSKYYTTKDTIIIIAETGDVLRYAKDYFNSIVDAHPELVSEYPEDPDRCYYCNYDFERFGSEAGQDNYYIVYAHLLKQKNGNAKYAEQRKKLVELYLTINALYRDFQHGGTYFGHQHARIAGYAEYSVYRYTWSEERKEKTYDITKQKQLYIQSLRQLIDDELRIDNHIPAGKSRKEYTRELNEQVDAIDKLITSNFYLLRAKEFQNSHYEYY